MQTRRRGPHRRLPAVAAACALVVLTGLRPGATPAPQARSTDQTASDGERLYVLGLSTNGVALDAIVQGDLRVQSTGMPCTNCHRRSGWGTAEGPVTVPPVVGSVLFQPRTVGAPQIGARTTGAGTRPAYTEASLLRAMRDGIDPAGRTLSPTMPRYELSEQDNVALAAHLRSLGAPPPGVSGSSLHLATIITPGVSDARRASMLDVLRRFVRVVNAETRNESGRRDRGAWDMKQHYESYRPWTLHEWTLQGDPASWESQLDELYRRQPVFGLLAGLGAGDWTPVHEFARRNRIPAILPQTPLPPAAPDRDSFYALYFSRGVTVEAQALAQHLQGTPASMRLLQVSRCGSAGQAAAAALSTALNSPRLRSECVAPAAPLTGDVWRRLLNGEEILVAWIDGADLASLEGLGSSGAPGSVKDIYLSASLLGEEALHVPAEVASRTALVSPFVAPDELDRHAWRALAWMKAGGIAPADRQVAVNTMFAVTLASDALRMPRTIASREYFIERIEHMAGRSPIPSAYPSLSFDAVRRIGSPGSQILKMPAAPGGPFRKVQPWFVPKT